MPDLDIAERRAPHGFHLLGRRDPQPFLARVDGDSPYQHRFTYQRSATSIADAAVEIVRGARRKVFLASFRIGDGPLLDAMYETVSRLRGGVYVITSWDESSLRRGMAELSDDEELPEDEIEDAIKAQKKRFDDMTRRGIVVRGHPSCHAKFLLADDAVALVSSANLETSALRDRSHRAATGESGAVLTEVGEIDRLARFFTRLWFEGCTGEAPPGASYVLRDRTPEPSPCVVTEPEVVDRPGVIWTHDKEQSILSTIVDIVGRAEQELLIASYNLVGLSERPDLLLDALAEARRRGVRVSLLVRGRNLPRDLRDAQALAALGVELHPDSLTHVKGVVADGRHGALFSANLDIDHGLVSGVEVGVRLDGTPALAEARRFLLHAMRHADLRFVASPTQRDLDGGYPARWRRPWPFESRLSVVAEEVDWRALASAVADGPVLYEAADSGPVTVYAGDGRWSLRRSGADWLLAPAESTDSRRPVDRLASWSRPPAPSKDGQRDKAPRRGFVTAVLERK